jgi:hypothetical protein
MQKDLPELFDRTFKFLITRLSHPAVIAAINGLFHTEYAVGTQVNYPNTEFINRALNKKVADILIRMGEGADHLIELQLRTGKQMILRLFDYAYQASRPVPAKNRRSFSLYFPWIMVIYLEHGPKNEKLSLPLHFPGKMPYTYTVNIFTLSKHTLNDLEERRLYVLMPYLVVGLRKNIKKAGYESRQELAERLGDLIREINQTFNAAVKKGLLTDEDGEKLKTAVRVISREVYRKYEEFKEILKMFSLEEWWDSSPYGKLEKQKIETERRLQESEQLRLETERRLQESERLRLQESEQLRLETERRLQESERRLQDLERKLREYESGNNSVKP